MSFRRVVGVGEVVSVVDWLIKEVTIPEIEDTEIEEPENNTENNTDIIVDDNKDNSQDKTEDDSAKHENPYIDDVKDENNSGGPRIPVLK